MLFLIVFFDANDLIGEKADVFCADDDELELDEEDEDDDDESGGVVDCLNPFVLLIAQLKIYLPQLSNIK